MSLLKENEDMKAQLAEAMEAEKEEEEQEEAEPAEEQPEEEVEPAEVEEEPAKEVEEEKPDNSAFAKLRREAAASKRLADERAREIEELKKPKEPVETEAAEVPPILAGMINDYQTKLAEREFQRYESEVLRGSPANAAIMTEYTQALQGALRLQNPRLSGMEIAELTKTELFRKAGRFQNEGYANPVEEMLQEAKELGFTGKSFEKEKEVKEVKPDLTKVAENRKRSAGMTGAAGREDGLVSKKTAAEMTPAEWKALDRAERARLMQA